MKFEEAEDSSPKTLRQYGLGAQILSALGFVKTHAADQFANAQGCRA